MEVELTEVRENPFLKRKEVFGTVTHRNQSTPTRQEIIQRVAALLNTNTENTVLVNIHSQFGIPQSNIELHVYDDPANVQRIEPKYRLKRSGLLEEAK
ncbi:MAG: 30S ribosomal protein S24e [Promethearchaeota archaeon]